MVIGDGHTSSERVLFMLSQSPLSKPYTQPSIVGAPGDKPTRLGIVGDVWISTGEVHTIRAAQNKCSPAAGIVSGRGADVKDMQMQIISFANVQIEKYML